MTRCAIPAKESLTVEFKSEKSRLLSDREIVENVVALANTAGGELYLGIEDNGTPTGAAEKHLDSVGMAAYIFNHTVPPVVARIDILNLGEFRVARIHVDQSRQIVSTSGGKTLQRRITAKGDPQVLPLYPQQFASRLATLQAFDYSKQPAPDATLADFDPVARRTIRKEISKANSSSELAGLSDEDFDGALGFTVAVDGGIVPTVTGILMIGTVDALERSVPTALATFQVLQGGVPRVDEADIRLPIARLVPQMEAYFAAWNPRSEKLNGMTRETLPAFDEQLLREALINAIAHRDYSVMGSVRVLVDEAGLTISSPGGFVQGVSASNLMSVPPMPRNACLADALKRAGYAERTGRGIDRIFAGCAACGRPLPDYSASNTEQVTLFVGRAEADLVFMEMLGRIDKEAGSLSPEEQVIFYLAWDEADILVDDAARRASMPPARVAAVVAQLAAKGVLEQEATFSGLIRISRNYLPASHAFRADRSRGHDAILGVAGKSDIIALAERNGGKVTTADVLAAYPNMNYQKAYRLMRSLVDEGVLLSEGRTKNRAYFLAKSVQDNRRVNARAEAKGVID